MPTKPAQRKAAASITYGDKTLILSYAHAKRLNLGKGIERNHLIPKTFFEKGPWETRDLKDYVPVLPLTFAEHRGSMYSFHSMRDGEEVGAGGHGFRGCGLNDYLLSRGLDIKARFYTASEVSAAIDVSCEYHAMIGIDHAVAAIRSFRRQFYDPVYAARKD
jgi:hypothetical protein